MEEQQYNKVYLIGYMGSGKTTLGKKLAGKLGMRFCDLDKMIEEREGMPVLNLFQTKSELYFRIVESEVLKSTNKLEGVVVSTGGGTPCFYENMPWMKQRGVTVYIEMEAGGLAQRLDKAKADRPLIAHLDHEGLREYIRGHLDVREPYYRQAHITVNGYSLKGKRLDELAEEIKKYLV